MTSFNIEPGEIAPFYMRYIDNIQAEKLTEILHEDKSSRARLRELLDDEKASYAYAEGKWTIKELILHCIDTEILFTSRALMFARGEEQNLPGYDHEAYVPQSSANDVSVDDLFNLWDNTRENTILLFNTFPEQAFEKSGIANENNLSVRGIVKIIPGHVLHHMKVLRTKYGLDI